MPRSVLSNLPGGLPLVRNNTPWSRTRSIDKALALLADARKAAGDGLTILPDIIIQPGDSLAY